MVDKGLWAKHLLLWYEHHGRDLPWRHRKDAYAIWLSEILLQQTRVEQGLPYYERFLEAFPDLETLAGAPLERVLRLWQGLGYYRRAHHLHQAAKLLWEEHGGTFPNSVKALSMLPGIGPYTAAALGSIAFGLPVPVVDGNVIRVLSRAFGAPYAWDSKEGKRWLQDLALPLLDVHRPGDYNQAMMDFGATVCLPLKPLCEACFWSRYCVAKAQDRIAELPFKSRKTKLKTEVLNYVVLLYEDKVGLVRRPEKGIWSGLYEFQAWTGTSEAGMAPPDVKTRLAADFGWPVTSIGTVGRVERLQHRLSHRVLEINWFSVRLLRNFPLGKGRWVAWAELVNFAMPRPLEKLAATLKENHGRIEQSHVDRQLGQRSRGQDFG